MLNMIRVKIIQPFIAKYLELYKPFFILLPHAIIVRATIQFHTIKLRIIQADPFRSYSTVLATITLLYY